LPSDNLYQRIVPSAIAASTSLPSPETFTPHATEGTDQAGAARYLAVSTWTVRDLEAAGHLPRVRLPLPGGKDLRKLLYDRADLDRLIETSKTPH
jgi:hypothetical protein